MIITRSPLRVTLGGGGTDVPSYYRKYGGFLIAAAIDRYVYVTVIRPFVPGIYLKYSKLEQVERVDDIQHPILRETIRSFDFPTPQLEITTFADIPAGTGLGSSGSFTTALVKALHAYRKNPIRPEALAEEACHIEIDVLREPIGKQDQYIAAFGGITCLQFDKDDKVKAWPLKISDETLFNLEDNLLLFFTGYARSASAILREQDNKSKVDDQQMLDNLHTVKELGMQSKQALESGDLVEFGRLMDVHWQNKRKRSQSMTNSQINTWYDLAMANGAVGGKLIGAGGGGFLMFYATDKTRLRHSLRQAGLQEVRFRFDFEGTKVVAQ
jgi:D-glycero-alpha-D-manno-heptose-7-phosphate kinase